MRDEERPLLGSLHMEWPFVEEGEKAILILPPSPHSRKKVGDANILAEAELNWYCTVVELQ